MRRGAYPRVHRRRPYDAHSVGVFIEQHQVGGVMGDNAVDIAQDTIQHFVEIECACQRLRAILQRSGKCLMTLHRRLCAGGQLVASLMTDQQCEQPAQQQHDENPYRVDELPRRQPAPNHYGKRQRTTAYHDADNE